MFAQTALLKHCTTRRLTVWVLLLALAVYGYSGVLLQLLGPAHRHHSVAPADATQPQPAHGSSLTALAQDWLRPVRAWRDEMHARSHAAGLPMHAHAQPQSQPQPQPHTHTHSVFERHHHDAGDPTVVALDGGGAAADAWSDGASAATVGSATLPLGLASSLTVPRPAARTRPWLRLSAPSWRDAHISQPERPPRA